MSLTQASDRQAITLVEPLAVIPIIAILIAVLFSAIGSIRAVH